MSDDAARFRGPGDVLLALRVAFWLLAATALFRRASLLGTLRLLTPRSSSSLSPADALSRAKRIQRYADALMRRRVFGRKAICWRRALVVYRLLPPRRPGDVRILFGVRHDGAGDLEGHAWVELHGSATDGTEPGEYRVTLAYPPDGPA